LLVYIPNIYVHEQRRKKVLTELDIVQRKVSETMLKARERRNVTSDRLGVRFFVLLHDKFDKYQVLHPSNAVEWQAEFLLPHGIEPIVFDGRGGKGYPAR
jgi:hypothetical protein